MRSNSRFFCGEVTLSAFNKYIFRKMTLKIEGCRFEEGEYKQADWLGDCRCSPCELDEGLNCSHGSWEEILGQSTRIK